MTVLVLEVEVTATERKDQWQLLCRQEITSAHITLPEQ